MAICFSCFAEILLLDTQKFVFSLVFFFQFLSIHFQKKPLCPDAFSSYIIRDEKMGEYNQDIVDATEHLKNQGIFVVVVVFWLVG